MANKVEEIGLDQKFEEIHCRLSQFYQKYREAHHQLNRSNPRRTKAKITQIAYCEPMSGTNKPILQINLVDESGNHRHFQIIKVREVY